MGDCLLHLLPSCGTGSKSQKRPAAAEGKAKASPKATKRRAVTEDDKTEPKQVAKAVETMNTGPEIDVTVDGKRFKVTMIGNCQEAEKKTDKEAKETNGEKKEKLAEESTSEKEKENDEDELPVSQTSTLVLGESPKKKKHTSKPKEPFCFVRRICADLL